MTEKVDNDGDSDEVTNGSSNGHTQPQNEETISTMPTSVHDIALQSAIDAMFRSREQTYQQFLHSFSHLTVGKEIIPANNFFPMENVLLWIAFLLNTLLAHTSLNA